MRIQGFNAAKALGTTGFVVSLAFLFGIVVM